MPDLTCIGNMTHVLRETPRAVLFCIGKGNKGTKITRYLPKSQLYCCGNSIYIPNWLAREVGIWTAEDDYERQGYTKLYDNLPF